MKRSFFVVVFFLLSLSGCLGTSDEGVNPFLLIFSSDYSTGELGVTSLEPPWTLTPVSVSGLTTDVVARYYGGKIYLVNSWAGNKVQILDPSDNFALQFEFSTGESSNPSDIAFVSPTKAYIARYSTNTLWIADLSEAPGRKLGEIDLSSFAVGDPDGLAEMSRMVILGNRLYVSIQRFNLSLDVLAPVGDSYLAVIDTDLDAVVDEILLAGANPVTDLIPLPDGRIAVGDMGTYFVRDGGVEIVNPSTGESDGFLVTEEDLGGDIIPHLVMSSPTTGYAAVDRPESATVQSFEEGVSDTLFETVPTGVSSLALDPTGHRLFVSDRTPESFGVRIFSTEDGTESEDSPISSGDLPPAYLLVAR